MSIGKRIPSISLSIGNSDMMLCAVRFVMIKCFCLFALVHTHNILARVVRHALSLHIRLSSLHTQHPPPRLSPLCAPSLSPLLSLWTRAITPQ